MRRKIKLTEMELNAKLNKALIDGYNKGYDAGLREGLFQKNTPNQIREILGLPPIKEKGEVMICNISY